jgi:hypothetical protein
MRNHWEMGSWVATPPAMARMMNPEATTAMSITATCLSQTV